MSAIAGLGIFGITMPWKEKPNSPSKINYSSVNSENVAAQNGYSCRPNGRWAVIMDVPDSNITWNL